MQLLQHLLPHEYRLHLAIINTIPALILQYYVGSITNSFVVIPRLLFTDKLVIIHPYTLGIATMVLVIIAMLFAALQTDTAPNCISYSWLYMHGLYTCAIRTSHWSACYPDHVQQGQIQGGVSRGSGPPFLRRFCLFAVQIAPE